MAQILCRTVLILCIFWDADLWASGQIVTLLVLFFVLVDNQKIAILDL